MKAVQKVTLSLLVAVVVFSLFSLFAFSGLFRVIESNFYDARVRSLLSSNLDADRTAIDSYNQANYSRFAAVLSNDSIRRIYSPNQSAEDIFNRANLFQKLEADYPGLLFVRFIDDRGNIHFSTLPADVLQKSTYQIAYKPLAQADRSLPANQLELAGPSDGKVIVGDGRLLYRLPAYDTLGERRGTAIFYVSAEDLAQYLVKRSLLSAGQDITLIPDRGILLNVNPEQETNLVAAVAKEWESSSAVGKERPVVKDSSGNQLVLFTAQSKSAGLIGTTVPQGEFSLNPTLRMLLSGSIFITTFLIAFLILNLRQDKLLVLSERIKRFQISFLKGYLESRQEIDWARWYRDLELRSLEVKREIKKGIGSLSKERELEVDKLIDKSWEDILSVLGKRVEQAQLAPIEVKGLEETIRRVLASAELKLPLREALPERVVQGGVGLRGSEAVSAAEVSTPRLEPARGGEPEEEEPAELEEVSELEAVEEEETARGVAGPEMQAAPLPPTQLPSEAVEAADEEIFELEPVEDEEEHAPEAPLTNPSVPGVEEVPEAFLEELPPVEEGPAEAAAVSQVPLPQASDRAGAAEAGSVAGPAAAAGAVQSSPGPREIDEYADLGLSEVEVLPDKQVAAAEIEELQPAEAGPSELPASALPAEGRKFAVAALDEVEALDLEAIFHGEELLADIDVFVEPAEEVESVEEILIEMERPPEREAVHKEERLEVAAGVGSHRLMDSIVEAIDELSLAGEPVLGEGTLLSASSGFSLLRGFTSSFERTAALAVPKDEVAELVEETAPLDLEEPLEELTMVEEGAETGSQPIEVASEAAIGELEPVEELSEGSGADGFGGTETLAEEAVPQSPIDFGAQVTLLANKKFIEIYTLSDISSMRFDQPEAVGVEGGLFKVREEIVRGAPSAEDSDFSSLVESVVSPPQAVAGEDEFGRFLAIPTVELTFDGMASRSRAVSGTGEGRRRTRAAAIADVITVEGLRYDAIRAQFRTSKLGVMKSLMRASQSVEAIYAAILLSAEGGLSTVHSLGLDERTASTLAFPSDDPVYVHLLSKRRLVYVRVPATGVPAFDDKLSAKDIRFMKGSIYLPIVFEGSSGYLFFGLKDTSRSIQDYLLSMLALAE